MGRNRKRSSFGRAPQTPSAPVDPGSAPPRKEIVTESARKVARIHAQGGIVRERTCPLLLRVFVKHNEHNALESFDTINNILPPCELPVYTWKDETLFEIAKLIRGAIPEARTPQAMLSFALIYPGSQGPNIIRNIGTVDASTLSSETKSLADVGFETGDFMDVAIIQRQPPTEQQRQQQEAPASTEGSSAT